MDVCANESEPVFPDTKPVDVIAAVEQFIRQYCILPDSAYLPLATWVVATYLPEVFDAFPYVALLSPAKGCGKTRVLEVFEVLCSRAWRGTSPTSAALYRMMETCPTLLLDEFEALRSKNRSEMQQVILAVLNAGHRKGATVPRCDGPKNDLKYFQVYSPKAFAAIGGLPDTLADRCICVTMERKTATQSVARFLSGRAKAAAEPLREDLTQWAKVCDEEVRTAYEGIPDIQFLSDRDCDLWMPLFAVCAVVSHGRLEELKRCSLALSSAKHADDVDDSLQLQLLSDLRQVWPDGAAHLSTANLLELLGQLQESPWFDHCLTPRKLSRLLRPFKVVPRTVRIGSGTAKGYLRSEMQDASSRYLPPDALKSVTSGTMCAVVDDHDPRAP